MSSVEATVFKSENFTLNFDFGCRQSKMSKVNIANDF